MLRIAAAFVTVGLSSAVHAQSMSNTVMEHGDFVLFAIAVAGLVIGRQASKRPPSAK